MISVARVTAASLARYREEYDRNEQLIGEVIRERDDLRARLRHEADAAGAVMRRRWTAGARRGPRWRTSGKEGNGWATWTAHGSSEQSEPCAVHVATH